MPCAQIELLVHFQDLNLMIQEVENEEEKLGFETKGIEALKAARDKQAKLIQVRYLRTYERLNTRYKRPIAPVQNETCLGCFSKLPTSYGEIGRREEKIMICENCGRILYWLD